MKITKFGNGFVLASVAGLAVLLGISIAAGSSSDSRSDVSVGQQAPFFRTTTVDGKPVNFPADYKGKIVLLDFWATWCPPCRAEIPHLVAAYGKYHDKGFDVLGVSLDQPRHGPALLQFLKDHNMTWPQIYDGGFWKAAVALRYGVHAIPCPILVDGDTGKIIATDDGALDGNLTTALDHALAGKAKK